MNKSLKQLFTAVIVLFTVLAASTTYWMAIKADALNNDPRNTRALYHEMSVPRGEILASDGTVLAASKKSNDAFVYQRYYPYGPIYAPVTGFFSVTNGAGYGIESAENTLLSGESNSQWPTRLKNLLTNQEDSGANIETSINTKLQTLAYNLMTSKGYKGAVIALNPKTGQILAMVSTPSYNPNELATHDTTAAVKNYSELANQTNSPLIDNAISTLYPPGSSFKIVTAGAALKTGKYTPDTRLSSPPSWTLPGTETQLPNVEQWRYTPTTMMPMIDCFAYSSNTAFAQLGVALGSEQIHSLATQLGFGSSITIAGNDSTGTPLTSAPSNFPTGQIPAKLALDSIGQGSTTETPLQNVLDAAAVANGGKLMRPTLVDRVRSSDLSVISQTTPSVMSTPFTPQQAAELNQMMQAVVSKGYPFLEIPGIKVAAKTGTAQIGSGPNMKQDAWITGFAPANDPQIAVAVVVQDANNVGGYVAGPIMQAVMKEALQ